MLATAACLPRLQLRATTQTDFDYAYFHGLLADPALPNKAVTLYNNSGDWPAVPVGGARRGGSLPWPGLPLALGARALLTGQVGFPDVRMHWAGSSDFCHTGSWESALRMPTTTQCWAGSTGTTHQRSPNSSARFPTPHLPTPLPRASARPGPVPGFIPPALRGGRS
ncbi:DUF6302 family protein [Streptomyces qinzhouensis]|uniref:DUF6302 family protein n=1 Tax=Streptomyces qinzhouensis TaxID=2599401 RepID=UPI001C93E24A